MADCSKTEMFLSEFDRMCQEYKKEQCTGCPARALANVIGEKDCRKATLQMPVNLVISAVQRWSDEHPAPKQKTYADVFWDKFPNAVKRGEQYGNLPMTCRDYIFGTGCPIRGCASASFEEENRKCADCWNEPYPEQEVSNG